MTAEAPSMPTRKYYAQLAVHPIAPSFARSHVQRVLLELGHEKILEPATLIASELVTNAIKASGLREITEDELQRFGVFAGADNDQTVWIGVYPIEAGVVVEVWDQSREAPKLSTPGLDDLGGRGLFLVNLLADAWGYRWPRGGGKIVWCQLTT